MTSLKGHCKSTRNYKTQVTNKTKQQNKAKQPQQTEKKNKHRNKKKNHKTLATAEGGGSMEHQRSCRRRRVFLLQVHERTWGDI